MNFGLDNLNFNFQNTLQSFEPLNFQEEEEVNIFENGLLQATLPQAFEQKWGENSEAVGNVEELNFQFSAESLEFEEKQKLIPNFQSNFDGGCGNNFTVQRQKSQTISFFGPNCVWDITNNSPGKEQNLKQQLSLGEEEGEERINKNGNENENQNETEQDEDLYNQPQILMFPTYGAINEEEENNLNYSFTNFLENSEQVEENETNYVNTEYFQNELDLYSLNNNLKESTNVINERKRDHSQTNKTREEQEQEQEQEQEPSQKQNDYPDLDKISTSNLLDETKSNSKTGKSTVYAREIDWQRKTFKIKKIGTKVLILKRKRKPRSQRLYTSRYGKRVLERWFLRHLKDMGGPYPSKRQRKALSRRADIPQLQVQRWFGQRRRVQRLRWENDEAPKPNWIDQD
ncbi:homeobox protein extradenticle [Anaeramoeba flamelloides]|uniref:Homeobox protein extradenticle n=1 Tax=Anaeramoeba flamelloides TaxID=1746091 RepID=A0AAV7ZRD7_9EUKA|nr:homeobox protein extradenticle [Anaeramoeba flamelloides]